MTKEDAMISTDLSSWPALHGWLASSYQNFEAIDDDLVRFDTTVDGRMESIGVRRLDARSGTAWVLFAMKIGSAACVPPVAALAASFEMPIGTFRVAEDYLIVGQTLPITNLAEVVVRDTLAVLVAEARMARAAISPSGPAESAMEAYGHLTG
jgi:hypothetical protein